MKRIFRPHIDKKERLLRGAGALALLAGAAYAFATVAWLGLVLSAGGAFLAFEAVRG